MRTRCTVGILFLLTCAGGRALAQERGAGETLRLEPRFDQPLRAEPRFAPKGLPTAAGETYPSGVPSRSDIDGWKKLYPTPLAEPNVGLKKRSARKRWRNDPAGMTPQEDPLSGGNWPDQRGGTGDSGGRGTQSPPEVREAREQQLQAVVRLTSSVDQRVCTATLIEHGDRLWIMTAAHCLFNNTFSTRLGQLSVEGLDLPLPVVEQALIPDAFAQCFSRRRPFTECVIREGAPDLALVPIPDLLDVPLAAQDALRRLLVRPIWKVATTEPAGDERALRAFGYGAVPGKPDDRLAAGTFDIERTLGSGVWTASHARRGHVDFGDSGGPALLRAQDEALHEKAPIVHFVVSAQDPNPGTATSDGRPIAWMQPTWIIESTLFVAVSTVDR